MALACEKCGGAAELAAQLRTFEYEGQSLRCLMFVSSCVVCGHHWEDETYETVNAQHIARARAIAAGQQSAPYDPQIDAETRAQDDSAA